MENNEPCVETMYELVSTVITFRNDVDRLSNVCLSFDRDFGGDHFISISYKFHIGLLMWKMDKFELFWLKVSKKYVCQKYKKHLTGQ